MPIQNQPDSRLRSRPISGVHALRALTAIAVFHRSGSSLEGSARLITANGLFLLPHSIGHDRFVTAVQQS